MFFLFLFSAKVQAQYVLVPDSNFRNYIKQFVDSNAIVGDSLDTVNTALISRKGLIIGYSDVHDFEGIQYFDSLIYLEIRYNDVDSFTKFPPQLQTFITYNNNIHLIDSLPNTLRTLKLNSEDNPIIDKFPDSLVEIEITYSSLDTIKSLPPALKILNIYQNSLSTLPSLPDSLKRLHFSFNQINTLPVLPSGLEHLIFYDNFLDSIPALPPSLSSLICGANNLHSIPILPSTLTYLGIDNNPLDSFPVFPNNLRTLNCKHTLSCLPKLPDSLNSISYDFCIPNKPVNLQSTLPLCIPPVHYYEIPDSIVGVCNDSMSVTTGYSSILWGTGDTVQSLYNLCPGTYTCTVNASNNCYYSSTFDVGGPLVTSYEVNNVCGSNWSSVNFSVGGGSPPYTYAFCGTSDTINPVEYYSTIATYYGWDECIEVIDGNGLVDSINILIPPTGIPYQYIIETNATCPGTDDGYYYSYNSPFSMNQCPFSGWNLSPGNYTVICSYNINCVDTIDIIIDLIFPSCDSAILDSIYSPDCGRYNGYVSFNCGLFNNEINDGLGFYPSLYYINGCPISDTVLCPDKTYYLYATYIDPEGHNSYNFTQEIIVTAPPGCSPVYPGDANNDGIANNLDLLSIGIAYSDTGTARIDTTITWDGKYVQDWINVFADSTNHKHADCNGNGIISDDDTLAIIQNYGLTHQRMFSAQYIAGAPSLLIDLPDSLLSNITYQIPVLLGDSIDVANNMYGIAFSIGYDLTLIEPFSIVFIADSNWFGNSNTDLIFINHNDTTGGQLDIGITRTDHTNRNGYGVIGLLQFKTKVIFTDHTVYFNTGNITALSHDEIYQPVNAVVDSALLLHAVISGVIHVSNTELSSFQILPNPNHGSFILQLPKSSLSKSKIEIINALGEIIYNGEIQKEENRKEINIEKIKSGLYTCRVISNEKVMQQVFVVK